MLPILLDIGFIKIYTFGIFLVLALFWGLFWFWKCIKLTGYREADMFDGVFVGLVGGLFLSRLTYVVCNFGEFGFDILKFILANGYPGASMFGFIIGSMGTFSLYAWRKHYSLREVFDYYIPALFISLSVAKMGSFLGGVDVGTRTTLPIAVIYMGHEGLRHIVGLYESIFALVGFAITYKILLRIRRKDFPMGTNLFLFFFILGLSGIILDNIKENHLYCAGFNINAGLSFLLFIVGTGYFLITYRRNIFSRIRAVVQFVKYNAKQIVSIIRNRIAKKS